MKKLALYILLIMILLGGGFFYLHLSKNEPTLFPQTDAGSATVTTTNDAERLVFKNYGQAPAFDKATQWLNSEPLNPDELTGKVVVVNFWTYSCISCVRALPYLDDLAKTYRDEGLVVIGVHTPEYAFEKVTDNVQNAIKQHNITYPVIQDNNYALWNSYNNQFWPASYVIDREGKIVFIRLGDEGQELVEQAVHQLIGLPGGLAIAPDAANELIKKPSTSINLGLKNIQALSTNELPTIEEQIYTFPEVLRRNAYALEGIWKISDNKIALTQGFGRLRLNFNAAKVQLNAQSIKPVVIKVNIDGKPQNDIAIQNLKNYELFSAEEASRHTLEIEVPQPGFGASQFIFE